MFSMTTDSVISSLRLVALMPVSSMMKATLLMSSVWLNCLLDRLTLMKSGVLHGEHRLPAVHLPARLAQHPLAERDDHAGLFRDRDEVYRRDEAALRVLPADERLEAAQAEVFERDDGLVVEHELVAFERAAHVGFELQEVDGARVHRLVEDFVARLAERLGAVHGGVGVAQDVFGALVAGRGGRDAHADGGEDLAAREHEGRGQLFLDALGDLDGLLLFDDIFDEDGELVAAEARDGVAGPEVELEAVGDADEELVADGVARASR